MSILFNISKSLVDFVLQDHVSHSKNKKILSIELVPFKMHGKNVRAVLSKELWKEVCKLTHERNNHMCCECGKTRREVILECHEVWEYKIEDVNPVMRMTNMLSLCHQCHMGKHIKFAERNGELEAVKHHLMKLYNLSALQFAWKVYKSVANIRTISNINFSLDLTYMNHLRYKSIHRQIGRQFTTHENSNCNSSFNDE